MISMSRIQAVAKQCKRLHIRGTCECMSHSCKVAELCHTACSELAVEISERQFAMESLLAMSEATRRSEATVRPDWVRPKPPDVGYFLKVINDGGEWCLHWHSDNHSEDCIVIEGESAWPFNETTAIARDWQKLGIEVV